MKILTSRRFASMQYTPILKQCEKIQVKCNFDNYYSFNSESDTENKKNHKQKYLKYFKYIN